MEKGEKARRANKRAAKRGEKMKRLAEEIEFDISDMHVAKHAKVHGKLQ